MISYIALQNIRCMEEYLGQIVLTGVENLGLIG